MDKKALANSRTRESNLPPKEIFKIFNSNAETWKSMLADLANRSVSEKDPKLEEIQAHIKVLEGFIDLLLLKRLDTIKSHTEELQKKYLKVIEPFFLEDALKHFIIHFFSVDYSTEKPDQLVYREKGTLEIETNILFDLFKAKRTIETINTLQNALKEPDHYKSIFSVENQEETLKVLKEILKLFFIKTINPKFRKELYQGISPELLKPGKLAQLKEEGISYLEEEMLSGAQFRNRIILLFFATEMRTTIKNKPVDIKFNYLDFEIIKNEFLIDWLFRKLKNNPAKEKILKTYKIDGVPVADLIRKTPEKEQEILQSIPIEQFNDMAEEINESVEEDLKVPIATESKKFGELASVTKTVQQAKKFAQDSVKIVGDLVKNLNLWPRKKKKQKIVPAEKPKEEPKEEPKSPYSVSVLNQDHIDFPYFDRNEDTYKERARDRPFTGYTREYGRCGQREKDRGAVSAGQRP